MSIVRVINGKLFSLRMGPGLASKAIVGIFLFGENLELIFIHDTSMKEMHTDQAIDAILDAYVSPYSGAIGDAFVLQDNNVRPHKAGIVDAYIDQKTIQSMQWPARSPDHNLIYHAWDALGQRVAAPNPSLTTRATI
ncbi:transposable element Tcb1 transposase [Trichonephila clavipes]|nr:transposable element Tcb1 transposase [Trichonephila clavipes]